MEECICRYVIKDDSRAGNSDVGAEVIRLGHVLNVLPVRPSREDDGAVAAWELAYGEGSYTVTGGGLDGVDDSLV